LTTSQEGRIFISYRRGDSAGYAGRIYDRLAAHFGADAIFMDVDTIEAGVDFVEVLQNAVKSCDVLIALIGRRWLNIQDVTGQRRLDTPEDFVRIEVAAALERDIRVIPVLVDGVTMPRSTELPDNLIALARRNALQVNHDSFNADSQRLISQLELALEAAERAKAEKVRREQEAREKKAAEERRRQEAAAKAAREKEEREKKEREARERQAEEDRRIKEVAEKAALEAAQREALEKARKERIAREKEEAEEKARKAALRKARQQETAEHIKNIFRSRSKYPFFVGVGIVILFLLGYFIKSTFSSSVTSPTPESITTEDLPVATSTDLPTNNSFAAIPVLGVGSTMISEKDGMVMVYVPSGKFQMGSEDGADDAGPIQTLYLDTFWIDKYEITNAMYARCVEASECDPPSSTNSYTRDSYYGESKFNDYPVIQVTWYDAKAYCEWTGRRLPTEAEWEKAAGWDESRKAQRLYPWGDNIDESYANYNQIIGDTVAVGSYDKGASFYGAYDMAGNVWEWVNSLYQAYPYNPNDGRENSSTIGFRVLRGGSWNSIENLLSVSYRFKSYPDKVTNPSYYFGFRCARDATP